MTISQALQESMRSSSWIRRMFEAGEELRKRHGRDAVFDFSLGSPVLEPPDAVHEALRGILARPEPGMHRYMPNNGYYSTREKIAELMSEQEQLEVSPEDVLMTVGAAGALNVALAAVLDPGDEVVLMAPYFAEYLFYARNHGGVARLVETSDDFDLDMAALDEALGPRTKAVIINTPNNPTGRIYSQDRIDELARLLAKHEQRHSRNVYLLADTPYASITYDGKKNPLLLGVHPSTFLAHSYSKELGLAGERIGFLVVGPRAPHREALRGACAFTNRTLGFVNAPALMQRAIERSLRARVDVAQYRLRRDELCDGLAAAGYELRRPEGAFYLFARCPITDDVAFTRELQQENILVVPGTGFGRPGHIRIAFCVGAETISRALPGFARVIERVRA